MSESEAELSVVQRKVFESPDEAVALGEHLTAATMAGPPYGLEYVNLGTQKVHRLPLSQTNVFLRRCDVVPGRLYSLQRAKHGWHLNMFTLGKCLKLEIELNTKPRIL